jgi:hypothetical protein
VLYSARLQPNAQTLGLARKTYQGHAIAYFVPSSVTKIQFFIIFVQCDENFSKIRCFIG